MLTAVVVGLAAVARWLLDPLLGDHVPFITFFVAIVVASWIGGLRTGLFAVALSVVLALYFFMPPRGVLYTISGAHAVGLVAFCLVGVAIAAFGEAMYSNQRKLAEREAQLRATLGGIGDGVITADAQGRVTSINPVAQELTGWIGGTALGQPLASVVRATTERNESVVLSAHDGIERHVEVQTSRIGSQQAGTDGKVLVLRDVTERRRAELALRNSEAALKRELGRMSRLQAIGASVVQAGEVRALLQEILRAAADLTGTDKGNIQLLNAATGKLEIFVHEGLGARFVQHFAESGWDATCEAAHRIRQRVIIEDVTQVASAQGTIELEIVLEDGIRAIQSTPLLGHDGRLLGMLNNHFRQVHRPAESDLRYLDLLARMAADLIERTHAEQELRESHRRKDEFLATLSHELRNPLAPISNAVQILRMGGLREEMRQAALGMVERQVGQLVRLIDDLLDMSRISRGKIELKKDAVDLTAVLNQVVEATRPACERQGQQLTVEAPAEPVILHADGARIHQILGNLLSNALKFTGKGGRIELTVEVHSGESVIRVRDDGIGIAPADLPRIFDLFAQVETSSEQPQVGLGIGLALVRQLVELHGGRVSASSDGPGTGSEFMVHLPLARLMNETSSELRSRPASPAMPPRSFLIVDDNHDAAASLATLLEADGHETRIAGDGLAALDSSAAFRPDVVLLDIGLPRLDGYEAARRIRARADETKPVLIALTGWGQDSDRAKSSDAGFDGHLVKPVDYPSLVAMVAEKLVARG